MAGSAVNLLLRITGVNGAAVYAIQETTAAVVKSNEIIEASSRDAAAAAEGADAKAGKATKGWGKYGAVLAGAGIAVGFSLQQFSKLEQATGSLEIVFGDQAEAMLTFTENAYKMGLSQAEAAQASAILGAQLQNMGATAEQAATITQEMVIIAGDLAAAMGKTVPQALAAMSAALRNEFDPLEQFGITINAAAVENQMLADEMAGVTYASEQQAKAAAILKIIQDQAAFATGAMEDEQETLSATTHQLIAATKDLAATLGGALGPVLAGVMGPLADFIHGLGEAIGQSEILTSVSQTLTGVLDALWALIEPILIPALELLNAVLAELSDFLERWVIPILEDLEAVFARIGEAIGTVIGLVKDAITWFDDLTDSIRDAIDALTFWNDTYDPNALDAPPVAMSARAGVGQHAPAPVTFNITTGVGDPHAIAREIRKILRRDEQRLGRVASWN